MIIRLTREQAGFLIEETRKNYPTEACGILFGEIIGEIAVVRSIVVTHNILESSTNFQINPEEFLKALSEAEKDGMQLLGFFHSHPAAPHPSMYDIKYMKLWPENVWLIISSINYNIEAYQTINDENRRIPLEMIKE